MAMKWHPDKNRGLSTEKEATEKFQIVSAAYNKLTEVGANHIYPSRMPWLVRAGQSDNGGLVVGEVLERRSSGRIFQFQPAIRL